ncbi:yls9-like [Stylosanthes scabra]|uniref:Yls9-like n=1 Tax=Stylosanthes scabra TaxID=79078 RepID=A0ABU6Q476_9FABA|nr:yls9-like [Stylosanthes scabra]
MADYKEQYGPSIPPPYNPNRSSNCLCCFFKVLITLIILLGLACLIAYFIIRPRPFTFHVTNANLTQFDYNTNKKTLDYNLVLNFTASNPNRMLSLYYDFVEANAYYQELRFSLLDLIKREDNLLRQSPKSTIQMSGVFKGQQLLFLDESQLSEFDREESHGVFNIFVRLDLNIRLKLGRLTVGKSKSTTAKCPIKVALSGNDGKIVSPFETIECNVKV